ncbi:helix-turn-helix domain-containing protein [Streptomyces sp. CBG9]|uniref:helix-turn-helix domain-containing protein n=1 Tax=Streptomyces sp. CBG9 TaxID=2762622 RepID=UPI0021BDDF4B
MIEDNLWKFDLSAMSRNVLDYLKTHHDKEGLVEMTQSGLAKKYGCSQSKVSRAVGQLSHHNFTWRNAVGVTVSTRSTLTGGAARSSCAW